MSLLVLDKLTRFFGGISAANKVDFVLERGGLHCLIGPNGAGKSTIFKLIMGLVKPQSGDIRLDGRSITRMQPYQRARIGLGMKYQTTRVFGNLTVGQNIGIAQSGPGVVAEDLQWSLRRLGLADFGRVRASELSYGQQHWLEMCMVLGNAPKVVLMDEPTAGMTPEETHETAAFLRDLNGRGISIIVIEHDMTFVEEIARSVTVLNQGAVFRQGTIEDIKRDPEVQRIYLGEGRG